MKYCSAPFTTISVLRGGGISSCLCPGWHKFGDSMGNLLDNSLNEIFSNEHFNIFRQSIVNQSFEYCKSSECSKLWNLDTVDDVYETVKDLPTLPTTMNVQIDDNCNLKCGSCRNDVIWSKPANPTVEKILDRLVKDYQDFPHPVWFQCDGTGDIFASTAYKNFFMRDDLPKCFQFNLTTNGNLVTKNLDILKKIKNQIFSVCVSFDAATEETYKDIRGGKFNLIIDGVKAMQDMGILRVNTSFVTQKKNYLELLDHYLMCKELNINYAGISKIDRWDHMSDQWWDENQIDNNPTVDYKFLITALKIIKLDKKFGLCGGLETLISNYRLTANEQKTIWINPST